MTEDIFFYNDLNQKPYNWELKDGSFKPGLINQSFAKVDNDKGFYLIKPDEMRKFDNCKNSKDPDLKGMRHYSESINLDVILCARDIPKSIY